MFQPLNTSEIAGDLTQGTLVNQYLQQLQENPSDSEDDRLKLALYVLSEGDFQQRWEVSKIFPTLGKIAIAPLLNILEDEETEEEIRWFVGGIFGEFDEKEVVSALVNLLKNSQKTELLMVAAAALGKIGTPAIEALSELLSENSARLLAVRVLAEIRNTQIITPLLKVVDDPAPEIRTTVLEALSSFHNVCLIPIFLKALHDPITTVRKEAVIALGMQKEFQEQFNLVSQLKPLLYDLHLDVCQQAALALGRLGGNKAAEALFHVLKSPATPLWLKQEVVGALSWICTPQSLEYLQEGLRWGDETVCQAIVNVLGCQPLADLKAQATEILLNFLSSRQQALHQPQIKQAVAMSLGKLGHPIALDTLEKLAQDSDKAVRLHAIAALKKFSPLVATVRPRI
ncbi:HEAT repeat domain-containing protein [Aphanothece sacrum]|nr:HEAT repeat domain-containing protein [Aphanothece sacrum]